MTVSARSPRSVTKLNDKLVPDEMVIENLLSLLSVLSKRTSVIQTQPQTKMEALNVKIYHTDYDSLCNSIFVLNRSWKMSLDLLLTEGEVVLNQQV